MGRVRPGLRDELKELYARGYTPTEIVNSGIRYCSGLEGIMNRLKSVARVETTVSAQEG
jgi:hypothetical protein